MKYDRAEESLEIEGTFHPSLHPLEDSVLFRRVVFEVQEEGLLNVRHFAVDQDYLHILVDEDLLRA
jgi:hypothetical protein